MFSELRDKRLSVSLSAPVEGMVCVVMGVEDRGSVFTRVVCVGDVCSVAGF